MILRFQEKKYVLISDLEKAFLQVGLNNLDRDTTRFLWLKKETLNELLENDREIDIQDLEVRRFQRMPFGINASPFLLASVIELHLSRVDEIYEQLKNSSNDPDLNLENKRFELENLMNELKENAYVDNFITMCNTEEEIKFKHHWSKAIFRLASMNLREFITNNENCGNEINKIEGTEQAKISKLLGIKWNVLEDNLILKIDMPKINSGVTKRYMLKIIAKNFDPMGWLSPVILKYKLFFQNLWKNVKDWNDILSDKEVEEWNVLSCQDEISFPRFPFNSKENIEKIELHIFADSSEAAYAAVGYFKINDIIQLIFSKTRLTPLKGLTIPKLELLALLIGVRLMKFIKRETKFNINSIYIWSDSKCVLSWLKSKKDLPVFIKNRIKEIKNITKEIPCTFHYIKSNENPADLASRGMNFDQLKESSLWWNGPQWLKKSKEQWPAITLEDFNPVEDESEIDITQINIAKNITIQKPFLNWKNFSSWNKLINIIRVLFLFSITILRKSEKFKTIFKGKINFHQLIKNQSNKARNIAEQILVRIIQKEMKPTDDEIKQLGIFENSLDIYQCGGRLKNASILAVNLIVCE